MSSTSKLITNVLPLVESCALSQRNMPHRLTKIDDARVFFGIVGSLFGSGYTVWLTLVAPHRNRLRQAKKFIEEISQTVNALTEDDKIAIDKYIAQVTAKDAKNTGCLLDTQHMFEELEKYAAN